MALPSSGQISFNDVRTETSQSQNDNFGMLGWVLGLSTLDTTLDGYDTESFSPINILSSGTRWEDTPNSSQPKRIEYKTRYSMSAWYAYDHLKYIELATTGTLYNHAKLNPTNYVSQTMIPVDVGLSNKRITIRVSGSLLGNTNEEISYGVDFWYGKPWNNNGSFIYRGLSGETSNTSIRQHVTWSATIGQSPTASIDFTYDWDYQYNAGKGQYLYIVLSADSFFT
jgi:hypothetical protein